MDSIRKLPKLISKNEDIPIYSMAPDLEHMLRDVMRDIINDMKLIQDNEHASIDKKVNSNTMSDEYVDLNAIFASHLRISLRPTIPMPLTYPQYCIDHQFDAIPPPFPPSVSFSLVVENGQERCTLCAKTPVVPCNARTQGQATDNTHNDQNPHYDQGRARFGQGGTPRGRGGCRHRQKFNQHQRHGGIGQRVNDMLINVFKLQTNMSMSGPIPYSHGFVKQLFTERNELCEKQQAHDLKHKLDHLEHENQHLNHMLDENLINSVYSRSPKYLHQFDDFNNSHMSTVAGPSSTQCEQLDDTCTTTYDMVKPGQHYDGPGYQC